MQVPVGYIEDSTMQVGYSSIYTNNTTHTHAIFNLTGMSIEKFPEVTTVAALDKVDDIIAALPDI